MYAIDVGNTLAAKSILSKIREHLKDQDEVHAILDATNWEASVERDLGGVGSGRHETRELPKPPHPMVLYHGSNLHAGRPV